MAHTYYQYEATPNGLSYLTGDIKPWEDYVVFRTDEYTSVAIYGTASEDLYFEEATVRTVYRDTQNGYSSSYIATEENLTDVTAYVSNSYYAYGNLIGVSYALPSSANITSLAVCSCVVVCALLAVFRTVWSLKRGTVK